MSFPHAFTLALNAGANAPVLIVATLTHFRRRTSCSSRKVLGRNLIFLSENVAGI